MKNSNYRLLIAYAESFIAFILPKLDEEINEIILFGSAARGEASLESDIDIFFDVKDKSEEKKLKNSIKNELKIYYSSKFYEIFSLKGIKNKINVEIGDLDKWKLKRSMISDGILLYGKYKAVPEKTKSYVYFNVSPIKNIAKRNKLIRILFGRKEKSYSSEGMLEKIKGKQLTPLSFIVPLENSHEIINILKTEKIDFIFFEFGTDRMQR